MDLNGRISCVEKESNFVTEKHHTVNIMGAYDVWQVVIFFFSWSFFLTYKYLRSSLKACLQNIMSSKIIHLLSDKPIIHTSFYVVVILQPNCKIQEGTTSNLQCYSTINPKITLHLKNYTVVSSNLMLLSITSLWIL